MGRGYFKFAPLRRRHPRSTGGGGQSDRYTYEIEKAPAFRLQVGPREVYVIVDGVTVATIRRPTEDQIAETWAAWKGGYDGDY